MRYQGGGAAALFLCEGRKLWLVVIEVFDGGGVLR